MKERKCVITFYDWRITSPPYLTIKVNEMVVNEPENDDGGVEFATILRRGCASKGYEFKFYSMTGDDFKDYYYEVVVYKPSVLPEKVMRKMKLDKINMNK